MAIQLRYYEGILKVRKYNSNVEFEWAIMQASNVRLVSVKLEGPGHHDPRPLASCGSKGASACRRCNLRVTITGTYHRGPSEVDLAAGGHSLVA